MIVSPVIPVAIAPIVATAPSIATLCASPAIFLSPALMAFCASVAAGAEIDTDTSSETIENLQVTGDISNVAEESTM